MYLRKIYPKQPERLSTEHICENASNLFPIDQMRAYCKSAPQYSCHISPAIPAEFGSSFFSPPISKLMPKKEGEKGIEISFNLTTQMCALIPTSTLESDMQASSPLSIQHGCLASLRYVSEMGIHKRCVYKLLSYSSRPSGYKCNRLISIYQTLDSHFSKPNSSVGAPCGP